jgi:hypothetical protein
VGESRGEAYLLEASRFQHRILKYRGSRQQEVMWPNALTPVHVIRSHLQDRRLTTALGCVGHFRCYAVSSKQLCPGMLVGEFYALRTSLQEDSGHTAINDVIITPISDQDCRTRAVGFV